MDKSWMVSDRRSPEYEEGVENFLEFALLNASSSNHIRCPCIKCGNVKILSVMKIRNHLYFNGINQSYCTWYWHGEEVPSMNYHYTSAHRESYVEENDVGSTVEMVQAAHDCFATNPSEFEKLLKEAEKPVYPGCSKFTKLSILVRLYNTKAKHGWTDQSFSDLLNILGELLPEKNEMPSSMYEAKKTLCALGMEYEKIHACPNDCILYRKEYKDATTCPTCGVSRWKVHKNASASKKGVPAMVLWYFPPIPRFKRMFHSTNVAKNLIWHAREREIDGKLRHPADSPSWKLVDHMWPDFAADPRNLRLAISADGINPHSSLSSRYTCWPVIMITYNLPPWLCMKRKFMMLTLLISGPKQPGNDIDVYLAPLVDDLKTLWEVGVEAYDAHAQEIFTLKAILLWTINDFPAYGNLCGCSVKGYYACPICGEKTSSYWLRHGKKVSFTGHRRFLPQNHPYRRQKKAFNNQTEFGSAPEPLSGNEILLKVKGIKISWGKKIKVHSTRKVKGRKRKVRDSKKLKLPNPMDDALKTCWKKKSIFFDLEYWKSLYVRHALDVMHIEKNVCENLIGTLLDIPGKTKDGVAARKDLMEMGVRMQLAPKDGERKTYLPPACYTLSREEKRTVCKTLSGVKVPKGYSSNFKNLVSMQDLKLLGLKSHDCHTLMQQLLPVAIRSVLPKHVRFTITKFCIFFVALCSKVVDVLMLEEIQNDLVKTLCLLEKIFPPSFFDIMVHLTVHLIREVRLCGPVYLRWMYPFERYMKILKGYVRNRYRPEGCMAECYIAEEAVEFCSEYLSGVDAVGIPSSSSRSNDSQLSGGHVLNVDHGLWEQAHRCVLENTTEVQPYIDEHMQWLEEKNPTKSKRKKWLQDEHNRTFINWLKDKVEDELENPDIDISETLRWIAGAPRSEVIKYSGYEINGCHYHSKSRDDSQVQQNSGVHVVANLMQVSSAKDKNPVFGPMSFYGVIQEIWELNYSKFRIPLFKCDWVEGNNGIKIDDLGFTLVDLGRIGYKDETFVLATQVKKVFYVEDPVDSRWSVVLSTPQRDWLDDDELGDTAIDHQCFITKVPSIEEIDEVAETYYIRDDCEGTWIERDALGS